MQAGQMYRAEIVTHMIVKAGTKDAVRLLCRTDEDENVEVMIWLSDKAMGMARQGLKMCGFSVDTTEFEALNEDPPMLAGNAVTLMAEEFNGKVNAKILLQETPSKSRLLELQAGLRAAKKEGETEIVATAEDLAGIPF